MLGGGFEDKAGNVQVNFAWGEYPIYVLLPDTGKDVTRFLYGAERPIHQYEAEPMRGGVVLHKIGGLVTLCALYGSSTRFSSGSNSLKSSRRLALNSILRSVTPVILPPAGHTNG